MKEYLLDELAIRIHKLSEEIWGKDRAIMLIGKHPKLLETQRRLIRYAQCENPILITGESGVGKELFAKSIYLFSQRKGSPFISVNCAQYQEPNMLISELFGHKKGSFTGAHENRNGIFMEYNDGVIFLDEIGELSLKAQGMLLRVLSEGEIKPLGGNRVTYVNTQIIAATNRNLKEMITSGEFREDLYYRLCQLRLDIPALRERGDDWHILLNYYLDELNRQQGTNKQFSSQALAYLQNYHWPGNIRELKSIINTGFFSSESQYVIKPCDFISELQTDHQTNITDDDVTKYFVEMQENGVCFWETVQKPYLDRELNRNQVRLIIQQGLQDSGGSYKRLLKIFNIPEFQYLKFMDFLRHHRLKPQNVII
ncbi:sigma-54-dependent Fis family transcriptional regulator [candidate division KSB1 bacterium]|nr:sigma-54-dependent Fis family transcriptional regulator [candidate division KSB1 bacterium]